MTSTRRRLLLLPLVLVSLAAVALLIWAIRHTPASPRTWAARAAARVAQERFRPQGDSPPRSPAGAATASASGPLAAQIARVIPAADISFEWLLSWCKRGARCGTATSDLALCAEAEHLIVEHRAAELAVRDGQATYDGALEAALLAEDEAAPCNSPPPDAWRRAFTGRMGEGAPCRDDVSCQAPLRCDHTTYVSGGRLLRGGFHRSGVCARLTPPVHQAGDACMSPWDCGPAMTCATSKTCEPKHALAATCRESYDCGDGLSCVAGRCVAAPRRSGACHPANPNSCEFGSPNHVVGAERAS